ncbi:DUF4350 domain-containing protein [Microbacterium sp. zg.B48]|uniref:DUF4350 domain-containing protein n=1 Tax=Microbacterium sp. zg.B48 TaxID=2969408 RepID=UPI00214C925B|nr:DUF4350 domain-containing protein [Microbacterium sp. zg.B48]MCR2764642.1 DUF4350 domain-containing protein [Microbacterium sp. zg.B48]
MTAAADTVAAPAGRRRPIAGWMVIAAALVAVGIAGSALAGIGQWAEREALDPESAGPTGARALTQILSEHGVDVIVARDRASAEDALGRGAATLAMADAPHLSDDALTSVADAATEVVLIEPRSRTLRLLLPGATPHGVGPGQAVPPACALPEAQRAGPVSPGAIYAPGPQATACFPTGGGYGLLVGDDAGARAVAVDGRALFTNEHLAAEGNAALAVNLLGRHATLVWYLPDIGDSDLADADASLGELTPPWVSPVIVLLLVAGITAAIWRGRRFGPLVAERMPVTVRAAETTEGRARLYAHARDALHAADQLRIGALTRLSRTLGLGPSASAAEISDATAARAGLDRGRVRRILIDELPRTDPELVALSEDLRALEQTVQTAVRPERNTR